MRFCDIQITEFTGKSVIRRVYYRSNIIMCAQITKNRIANLTITATIVTRNLSKPMLKKSVGSPLRLASNGIATHRRNYCRMNAFSRFIEVNNNVAPSSSRSSYCVGIVKVSTRMRYKRCVLT